MITEDTNRPTKLSEMARRLGVSTAWLRAEAEAGRLPHVRAGTGMLFDAATVERILSERARKEGANRD
jgi:excisionase family DNA binding protein